MKGPFCQLDGHNLMILDLIRRDFLIYFLDSSVLCVWETLISSPTLSYGNLLFVTLSQTQNLISLILHI